MDKMTFPAFPAQKALQPPSEEQGGGEGGGEGGLPPKMASGKMASERARPPVAGAPKRPEGHGSAADAPLGQNDPASHSEHAVCPATAWYVPASHGAHAA